MPAVHVTRHALQSSSPPPQPPPQRPQHRARTRPPPPHTRTRTLTRYLGHDRGVDDAQRRHAVHPQVSVHHARAAGVAGGAHLCVAGC